MRDEDRKALAEKGYKDSEDTGRSFAEALGVHIPSAHQLAEEIFDDLDENGFGVSWWRNQLPTQFRILVGDYLWCSVKSIEENCIEAKLHLLELADCRERLDESLADAVSMEGKCLAVNLPPSKGPLDDLPRCLATMHMVGFFRAAGSALDCLGAAVTGVLGLKINLRRCDLGLVVKNLGTSGSEGGTQCNELSGFREEFHSAIEDCGPAGWYQWAILYRNMLVHRGRRAVVEQLAARPNPVLGPDGRYVLRSRSVAHLPLEPDLSDVEAFREFGNLILQESADATLCGILHSTVEFAERVCKGLLRIWRVRRCNPQLIVQPESQWNAQKARRCAFNGYKPGTMVCSPTVIVSSPEMKKRLRAAGLLGCDRQSVWGSSGST